MTATELGDWRATRTRYCARVGRASRVDPNRPVYAEIEETSPNNLERALARLGEGYWVVERFTRAPEPR